MLPSMVEMYSMQDHAVVVFTNEVIYEVILALSFWYLMYFFFPLYLLFCFVYQVIVRDIVSKLVKLYILS
jgi:hypothetical protein